MLTGMSTGRLGVGSRSGHDMLGNLDLHAFHAAVTHSGQIYLRASKSQFLAKSPEFSRVKGVGNQHDVASALFCTFLVGETLQRAGDVPFFNIRPILILDDRACLRAFFQYQAYSSSWHPIVCLPHRLQAMG